MQVRVYVSLKSGVLDPQGQAALGSLHNLGFAGARDVRIGKYIELDIDADSAEDARAQADAMAARLLCNTVIESYRVEVVDA